MKELLTTNLVTELLQVDQTTVYRLLKNGRLPGVKIGNQWRFSRQAIEKYLQGESSQPAKQEESDSSSVTILPLSTMQAVQDICADIANIGSVVTDTNGNLLTKISNPCQYCQLILNSHSGRLACQASWKALAQQTNNALTFVTCHAGLQYAYARVNAEGAEPAMLIAGQFYVEPPEFAEETARVQKLAAKHDLDLDALQQAVKKITVLDKRKRRDITHWLEKAARTFVKVAKERASLFDRFQRIVELSSLK